MGPCRQQLSWLSGAISLDNPYILKIISCIELLWWFQCLISSPMICCSKGARRTGLQERKRLCLTSCSLQKQTSSRHERELVRCQRNRICKLRKSLVVLQIVPCSRLEEHCYYNSTVTVGSRILGAVQGEYRIALQAHTLRSFMNRAVGRLNVSLPLEKCIFSTTCAKKLGSEPLKGLRWDSPQMPRTIAGRHLQ